MNIDNKLLTKLEKLSSLEIEDDKREEIISQLSEIVNFVENLNELDLEHNHAAFTTLSGGTPLREDLPFQNQEVIKTIFKYAPKSANNFFVVPKIIE